MSVRAPMVKTKMNGRWTLPLPDYRAEREEWRTGWERERLDSMHANLGEGDLIYDIGTEEGDLTGLYALWGCEVVMVEPNHLVWPNVKAIFEEAGFDPPVGWFQGFASNTTTPGLELARGDWPPCADGDMIRAHGFTSMVECFNDLEHVRIDDLANLVGRPPTAITIDVEGAEMLVLEGAAGVLDSARPLVWVSVHDEMIRYDYNYTSESVHQHMALHGYRMQLLAIDHECHWFYWPKERRDVLSTLP